MRRSRRHSHRMIESLIEMSEVVEQMVGYIHVKRIVLPVNDQHCRPTLAFARLTNERTTDDDWITSFS